MTHVITENLNGTTTIQVDFTDEGVELQGSISIKGDTKQAEQYLPIFEKDLRQNFAEKFPMQDTEQPEEGGMM